LDRTNDGIHEFYECGKVPRGGSKGNRTIGNLITLNQSKSNVKHIQVIQTKILINKNKIIINITGFNLAQRSIGLTKSHSKSENIIT